jgi:hypothetical protein
MLNQIIKTSAHGSFQVTQLCKSIAICEALKGDKHDWGNATTTKPAFLVYFGCNNAEIEKYVQTFQTFYRTEWCEVRKPKYLKGFEAELKIKGMVRYSDIHQNSFGLDYLMQSELNKEDKNNFGIVQNGIYQIPAYTRIKLVTFETNDGNKVEFQLDADYPMAKLIQILVSNGDSDNLTYIGTEYFWQRNWDQDLDGEF